MKYYALLIITAISFSCQNSNNTTPTTIDTISSNTQTATPANDSTLAANVSKAILSAIKNKDYTSLAAYIKDSLRFSPYGYIDTASDKVFTAPQLLAYFNNNKNDKIGWGSYDGTGDTILLTAGEYFKKFVYDVDFMNAPQKGFNKRISSGNSLNNIDEVYKDALYMEFYFPGFDARYGGMDWRSLKLVFKKENNQLKLIAIIHDQWTT